MLLTTFIIDYEVVLTAERKASDKLDMYKLMFLRDSFRQPPRLPPTRPSSCS